MFSLCDWFFRKMRLIDDEKDNELKSEKNKYIFCNKIVLQTDCNELINHYKAGAVCIFTINTTKDKELSGIIQYLYGAIYALEGIITEIGEGTYIISHNDDDIK